MTTPNIPDYLKYANLQMAAEAFLVDADGTVKDDVVTALKEGNLRASKFPEKLAADFANDWVVVDQCANTNTGFSGTLFRCKVTDPNKGLVEGQLVLSFRSTEFLDDAAHDNQGTNGMEIAAFGWAFGQIADMEAWYKELKTSGKLPAGQQFSVTGYSLGAHLATAFNLLRNEEALVQGQEVGMTGTSPVQSTFTFNGAGVGSVQAGKFLSNVIADFVRARDGHYRFSDPYLQQIYQGYKTAVENVCLSPDAVNDLYSKVGLDYLLKLELLGTQGNPTESWLLKTALRRVLAVVEEAYRAPTLSSGTEAPSPKFVPPSDIAPTSITNWRC